MQVKRKVLVVGRHTDLLQKVLQLLQHNGYEAFGETTNEGAISSFQTHRMDAVIIGGGVDFPSRDLFHLQFPKLNPDVKIIDAHPQTVLTELKNAFLNAGDI